MQLRGLGMFCFYESLVFSFCYNNGYLIYLRFVGFGVGIC